jgi:hypothetical protein
MGGGVQEKCTFIADYKNFKFVIERQKNEFDRFFVKLLKSFQ